MVKSTPIIKPIKDPIKPIEIPIVKNILTILLFVIPIVFIISTFLVILCWPHIIVEINKGNFFLHGSI